MARDRANIRTNIWADDHWRELTVGAQWLYEFILTNAGLNLCGVMDWRPAKWTGMSADATRKRLEEWAAELEREHFVVIDRDREEVLIRAFFRHDGILSQPNPMKGAAREFATIGSGVIRGVISHELSRLADEFPNGVGKANVWELVPELRTLRKTPPIDIRNPSVNPSGNPSDTSTSTPTPTETTFPSTAKPEQSKASVRAQLERDFDSFWEVYPRKEGKQAAKRKYVTVRRTVPADLILEGARAYALMSLGKEKQHVKMAQGWLNDGRFEDEFSTSIPLPPRDLSVAECRIHRGYPLPCDACAREEVNPF